MPFFVKFVMVGVHGYKNTKYIERVFFLFTKIKRK